MTTPSITAPMDLSVAIADWMQNPFDGIIKMCISVSAFMILTEL